MRSKEYLVFYLMVWGRRSLGALRGSKIRFSMFGVVGEKERSLVCLLILQKLFGFSCGFRKARNFIQIGEILCKSLIK